MCSKAKVLIALAGSSSHSVSAGVLSRFSCLDGRQTSCRKTLAMTAWRSFPDASLFPTHGPALMLLSCRVSNLGVKLAIAWLPWTGITTAKPWISSKLRVFCGLL